MRIACLSIVLALAVGTTVADPPANSAGVGVRGAARDPTSPAAAAKLQLFGFDLSEDLPAGVSLRPKLLYSSYLEARLPLTFEVAVSSRVIPFVSVGEAFNTDDFGHLDHMFGFGADVAVSERLTLGLTCNLIYQRRVPDRDTELILVASIPF